VSENNLRVKRRDPWLRANAPSKAVADPGLVVETRRANHRRVFIWFASWWRNHQLKQAEKPHSKSSVRKALDGPATRPKTPLAVENGVGKLTASERGAPNVGMGKRAWRTPIPHLSLLDRKAGQGLIVFGGEKTSNIEHRTSNMELKTSR
jgi:hypothetical protein